MLKYKHMRLDQTKIQKAQQILKAKTETETLDRALDRIIIEDRERNRRKKIMKRITDLRIRLGATQEDPALWVHLAREERDVSHDSRG